MRIARTATQASLLCHHRQGGMKTITRTRGAGGFQEPPAIACILGGAQAPASQCIFKQFAHEVNVVLPKLEATRPLRWSACAITFSSADQLKCVKTARVLPMRCSPVISNMQVTRTLIDGGAGPSRCSAISKCRMINSSQPSHPQEPLMVPLFR